MKKKQIGVDNEYGFKYMIFGAVCETFFSYIQHATGNTSLKLKGEVKA